MLAFKITLTRLDFERERHKNKASAVTGQFEVE